MNIVLFLFIAAFFSLTLGEFGQYPFGQANFSISIMDILLTLSLSFLLIWNIGIKKNLKLPPNFIFLILFWTVAILSLFFSLDLSGWLYLLRFIIYSSTLYITFNLVRARILSLNEFLTLLKITCLTLGTAGLLQLIFYPNMDTLSLLGYDPHKNRVFSTFLDPNLLGTFLNFGLVISLYEIISQKFSLTKEFIKQNKFNLINLLILMPAVILTFSRSAYLMLVISLLIILAIKNRKLLAIFAVLTLVLYLIFPAFNTRINGAINIDDSAKERFSSWDKGLLIFQQNPGLGVGFNNLRNYSQHNDLIKLFSADGGNSGAGVDSSLIFVLATTGLVGFLAYVVFIIRNLADLIASLTANFKEFYNLNFRPIKILTKVLELPAVGKWYRESPHVSIKSTRITLPLFALSLGLIVGSFFINSLFFPPVMIVWFSLLGVFSGLQLEA